MKKQPPQRGLNEFWDKFTTKHPGKIFTILPDNLYAKRAAAHAPKGTIPGQNAVASYEEAADACKKKVAKIVKECRRLNQKYRDPHFDIESDFKRSQMNPDIPPDCLTTLNEDRSTFQPMSVKRIEDIFEKPRFFIEGASASDVRQGNDGDCWLMSALCTISNKEGLVQRVCVARDEQVGVYGFVFHRDGEWISEVIDDKLYLIKEDFDEATLGRYQWLELQNRKSPEDEYRTAMQTGSRALYFAQCSDPNETWLPLLEKAYAKAHGDYSAIDGGFVGEGIEDLTGGVTSEVFATDILDKDKFWREELLNVNKTFLFGCGQMGGIYGERKGIQEKHAYSIMEAREIDGHRLLKLRNPWGKTEWNGPWSDGSEEWTPEWMQKLHHKFGDDGVFWISYKDLLRHYQHFDRTRLFGPEWTISQQWTSVNVPWSVDYLDTKFRIKLSKPSPVVIVLNQLDDRYFQGLEGQYEFQPQFRLHKDDEEEYIVRSNGTYYMKRSVSTELDLEAGNYTVLLKIKATRLPNPTPEDVIRATCTTRREKLLSRGLSYDLAHAKGQFREQAKEKERREHEKKKERKKAEMKHAYEQRRKLRKKTKLREKKKAAKLAEKKPRSEFREVDRKLQDISGLGINVDEEDDTKPMHPTIAMHQRAASTGTIPIDHIRDRSVSPSGGFGGRGGYNKGRGGYNAEKAAAEALPLTNRSVEAHTATRNEAYQGRGGYNFPASGLPSANAFQAGRDGYNMGRDGYNMGRDGYNMGRDGYNIGRDGYNIGRDGYNENESPVPTTGTDEFRPGTPSGRTYSPRPDRRPGQPSPTPSRRATLSPIPGIRPGISVTRGRGTSTCSHRAREGVYSPSELSDDSSWDSELDGPDSSDSDLDSSDDERFYEQPSHSHRFRRYEEEEDEFERDPWNAVCVVGLRVFSKDTDVEIEVQNGEGERKKNEDSEEGSMISNVVGRKEKELDVDDSAADATSPLRTRGNLDSALAERVKLVGDAPAGKERDQSGTLS
ncbi:cysteine proteinase [Lindgomyces ingoldianus]|uniref:Cysteine proteinase n=1 Tax=Lindgomyces ingoldianus TaxID=673940 RepID=A0ACB6QZE4_9PLEO|nr:cysteine proteinase [Lindgomyces ingoldianus]KAF2472364.1 cysteine proteinase [Lindgomyces ingoldianus]